MERTPHFHGGGYIPVELALSGGRWLLSNPFKPCTKSKERQNPSWVFNWISKAGIANVGFEKKSGKHLGRSELTDPCSSEESPAPGKVTEREWEKCKSGYFSLPRSCFCSTWTLSVCREHFCAKCSCGEREREEGEEFLSSGCYCSVLLGVSAIMSPGSHRNDSFGVLTTT